MENVAYHRMFSIEENMWWYRGRRAVCGTLLRRMLPEAAQRRILDVGCGTGFNMRLLERFGAVEGVDFSPQALAYCTKRGAGNVKLADATSLPYAGGEFQLVTAFDLIEHLDDDCAALREFARVLQPGGHLLVFTPALPALYGYHDRVVGHRRRYTRSLLRQRILASGFSLRHLSSVNLLVLPAVLMARFALGLIKQRPHLEMSLPPDPVNTLLTLLCKMEVPLVTRLGLPFGLSLVALARREK